MATEAAIEAEAATEAEAAAYEAEAYGILIIVFFLRFKLS